MHKYYTIEACIEIEIETYSVTSIYKHKKDTQLYMQFIISQNKLLSMHASIYNKTYNTTVLKH